MQRLWATWRMEYITGTVENKNTDKDHCIFCSAPKIADDEETLICHRGKHSFIIMNLYPYNNGHLMIIPYRHTSDITSLTDEESLEIMKFVKITTKVIKNLMNPEGFNIGMNVGRPGGAGIAEHLHMHVVPRWTGDNNFMPVLGDTRVISEHIEVTYKKIKDGIKALLESESNLEG